jgi:hypothetical protein
MQEGTDRLQATVDKTARKERFQRATGSAQLQVSNGPLDGNSACIFDKGCLLLHRLVGVCAFGRPRHQGTDVMAPNRANVYAFTDGTIGDLTTGGLGGIALRINGDDGHRYYYAHLDAFADGITSGKRVKAGQLVGYNGSFGNASGGPTHVHVQLHPNGGAPANLQLDRDQQRSTAAATTLGDRDRQPGCGEHHRAEDRIPNEPEGPHWSPTAAGLSTMQQRAPRRLGVARACASIQCPTAVSRGNPPTSSTNIANGDRLTTTSHGPSPLDVANVASTWLRRQPAEGATSR